MSAAKIFQSSFLSVGAASVLSLATVLVGGLPSKAQSETILNQPNANPGNLPVLSIGAANNTVEEVQRFLQNQGYYQGPIDGIYGSQTSNAVAQFQAANQLAADGIIGENTWDTMLSLRDNTPNSGNQQPMNDSMNNYPDNSIQQPGYDQQTPVNGEPMNDSMNNYPDNNMQQPGYNEQDSMNQQSNNVPANIPATNYPDRSLQQDPGYDQQDSVDQQSMFQNDMNGQPMNNDGDETMQQQLGYDQQNSLSRRYDTFQRPGYTQQDRVNLQPTFPNNNVDGQ